MFKIPQVNRKKVDTKKLRVAPVKVYVTQDYDMFKHIIGNREVNERHAGRLTTRISKKDRLANNPISINEYAELIDGQHRLRAAKTLRRPIYFTISEGDGLEEVQELNSGTKIWTVIDYLNSYIANNKPEYVRFKEFIERYQLSPEGAFILVGDNGRSSAYRKFKAGVMSYTEEQWEEGQRLADALFEIKPYFVDTGIRRVFLYHAIRKVDEMGHLNLLVEKVKTWNPKLQTQYSLRDYLRMFEDVINTKNRTGKPIRLFG